ncbi:MAG: hypothetical protein JWQ27_2451 [Ferruginibacter sp.]|nr:hypothetical protein [Ferruginibacter sp.]
MRKILSLLLIVVSIPFITQAQSRTMEKVLTLKMPDDPGARASAIAWHPTLKRYYAPKSGNASFSMAIFDPAGNLISPSGLTTKFDIRGIWYNPTLKTFCANGYKDNGWITYVLDKNGIPTDIKHDVEYMNQPEEHSVGFYNPRSNEVYFLKNQDVIIYNASSFEETGKRHLFVSEEYDEPGEAMPDFMNSSTVVYTGIPGNEFGLLNADDREINLFDKATGKYSKALYFPLDAPTETFMCFTYCNGLYFLFDTKTKSWYGYR